VWKAFYIMIVVVYITMESSLENSSFNETMLYRN